MAVVAGIIIIVRDKQGKEIARIEVKDAKSVEVIDDGKAPPKDAEPPRVQLPVGASPFDRFQAKDIPAAERFDWQPKELVAVLGEHGKMRHWGAIASVALDPKGKYLAIQQADKVRLFDVVTGRRLGEQTVTGRDTQLQFSRDGDLLKAGCTVYHVPSLESKAAFDEYFLGLFPDGRTAAGYNANIPGLRLWNVDTGKNLAVLPIDKDGVPSLAFSADGKLLAGCGPGGVVIWDVPTKREFDRFPGNPNVVFDPLGRYLADGGGMLRDLVAKKSTALGSGAAMAFSPDGRLVALSHERTIMLRDVATRSLQTTFWTASNSVSFSPDGKILASATGNMVQYWDATAGTIRHALPTHKGSARSVAYSGDGKLLASAGEDGKIKLYDPATGKAGPVIDAGKSEVDCVALNPDGKSVVAGTRDGSVKAWDASGKEKWSIQGHLNWVQALAFSPDGKTLLTASKDGVMKLRDPATGKTTGDLAGHSGVVNAVVYSRDGKRMASVGGDNVARLWDAATGKELAVLSGHGNAVNGVAFSPDGKTLLTGSDDGTARTWDVATGKELLVLKVNNGLAIRSVAFAPDGKTLATGGQDGTVRFWLAGSDLEWITLHGHKDAVHGLAFSPDGETIATAGQDGKVLVRQTPKQVPGWEYPPKTTEVLAVSPDGKFMVMRNWGASAIWSR